MQCVGTSVCVYTALPCAPGCCLAAGLFLCVHSISDCGVDCRKCFGDQKLLNVNHNEKKPQQQHRLSKATKACFS